MFPPNIYYSTALLIAGLACLVVAIGVWHLRSAATGARSLVVFMLGLAWWSITYAIFWAGIPGPSPYFWLDMTMVGANIVPTALLVFALEIALLRQWLIPSVILGLIVEPVTMTMLLFTDPWHDLYLGGKRALNTTMLQNGGPASWTHLYYSYLLIFAAILILVVAWRRSAGYFRKQIGTLLVAIIGPLAINIISVSYGAILPNADMTPFLFSVTALVMAYSLWHYRLLDVAPIANDVIIENMNEGVLVFDAQNRITAINPAAQKILKLNPAQVIGKPSVDALANWTDLATHSLDAHPAEEIAIGEGDACRWYKLHVSPLQDNRNRSVGRVAMLHNVTEQKQARDALVAARDMALEASRAKSTFLASMSHEIRTPMNGIIGMTGLLLDTKQTAEQREFVETIRQSGEALLTIINDILDFSKIEAGKLTMESQPFHLRDCLEAALDLFVLQAAEMKIEMGCIIEQNVPEGLVGDVTRLRQIIVNLLSNAVKFTKHGEIVLEVKVEDKIQPGNADARKPVSIYILHFIVQDTGIGISPEGQRRLFQSFSQVDASTTRKYGGTGLGLVISKRLAELMGGEMWLESTEGVGSKFHFTIKMPAAELRPAQNLLNVPQLKGKRLLIVDDNETSRRILTLQAQSWGMSAHVFGNPLDALTSLLHGDAYDVGILDMHMPEMDGVTLASKIRANGLTLPLIMLTSLGWRDPSETVNFSAFLTKPVKQSILYDAIIGVLALPDAPVRRNAHLESLFDPGMATGYPLRILLAEDNAVNQKLALRMLERFGYRADVAGNGLEVVQALERQPYDVVLMDVQMPEMDGLESTRQIRGTLSAEKQPRIIAMTANAMQGDREACLAAGMDDYIGKPINIKELSRALKNTFEQMGKPSGELRV